MKRFFTCLAPALLLVLLAGCDSVDDRDDYPGVSSFNFTFSVSDADVNGPVASAQYEVPAITERVVDGGAVLAYFREQGTWTAMPFTYGVESTEVPAVDYTVTLGYAFDRRLLEVFYEVSSEEAVSLRSLPDRQLKIVVIDGFPAGKNAVDLRDYEAVKAYYGLED